MLVVYVVFIKKLGHNNLRNVLFKIILKNVLFNKCINTILTTLVKYCCYLLNDLNYRNSQELQIFKCVTTILVHLLHIFYLLLILYRYLYRRRPRCQRSRHFLCVGRPVHACAAIASVQNSNCGGSWSLWAG